MGPWAYWVLSGPGLVRREQQDNWLAWARHDDAGDHAAFAVFDGMGGLPHGRESADAARASMLQSLEANLSPRQTIDAMTHAVHRVGGGSTLAGVIIDSEGACILLSIGDSSIYAPTATSATRVNAHDRASRHRLTAFLGRPGVEGHITPHDLPAEATMLLCTDGFDEVVPEHIAPILHAASDALADTLQSAGAEVLRRGAPDNFTCLVARRAEPTHAS